MISMRNCDNKLSELYVQIQNRLPEMAEDVLAYFQKMNFVEKALSDSDFLLNGINEALLQLKQSSSRSQSPSISPSKSQPAIPHAQPVNLTYYQPMAYYPQYYNQSYLYQPTAVYYQQPQVNYSGLYYPTS
jgi:hypothetical protein